MTSLHETTLFLLLVATPLTAGAVTVYQCEDESGQRTFQDRCPPGTKPVMETRYGPPEPAPARTEPGEVQPVTLYVVPECESCEQVREYLQFRNVAFTEVNVADDVELQNQLKEAAGQLRVPATVIGERAIVGYNRSALSEALSGAGYAVATEASGQTEGTEGTAEETAAEEEEPAEE